MFIIWNDSSETGTAAAAGGRADSFRDKERKRKESEQYLMVNFPADVRKNLKGIVLPANDKIDVDTSIKNSEKVDKTNEVKENDDEGNLSQGREICLRHINHNARSTFIFCTKQWINYNMQNRWMLRR